MPNLKNITGQGSSAPSGPVSPCFWQYFEIERQNEVVRCSHLHAEQLNVTVTNIEKAGVCHSEVTASVKSSKMVTPTWQYFIQNKVWSSFDLPRSYVPRHLDVHSVFVCVTEGSRSNNHKKVSNPYEPWRRAWQPTPVFLPGESHRERNLAGYSPWGCKELDMTEET